MSASRTPEQKIAETTAGAKAAAVVAIIVQLGLGVQLAVSGGGTGATMLFLASTAVLVAILAWLLVDRGSRPYSPDGLEGAPALAGDRGPERLARRAHLG